MGKRFKILSFLLIVSLLAGCLPTKEGKAATANLTCETKKGTSYVNTADEALDIMEKEGGGKIILNTTVAWTTKTVRTFHAHTKIVIPENMTMTLEGAGMQGGGSFEVSGTLDLKNSTCNVFHVTGEFEQKGRGVIVRQVVNMGTLEKTSDIAAVLTYGQKLPNDTINDLLVGNRVYKEGGWRYRDLTTVFEAGIHTVSVYYDYNKTIFTPHDFNNTVQIRVDKADPALTQYTIPEVEQGQAISTLRPKYSFTNPNTGEMVAGTLQFSDGATVLEGLGERQLKASFVPNDSKNYNSLSLSLKVKVVTATPKIAAIPYTSKGQYGQMLKDISLQQGNCVDSLTGEIISGSWAWKKPNDPLVCGEHTYPAVFTPADTKNYKSIETLVSVQTAQKKMTVVSWPTVSAINEGQHLFEAALAFNSNEYGTFLWEDDTQIPPLEYQGAVLVFAPFDTENYDWTNVVGYDARTKTVKKTVALSVIPKPTEAPKPTEKVLPTEAPKPTATSIPTVTPIAPTLPPASEKPQITPEQTAVPTILPTVIPTASALPSQTPESTADVSPLPTEGTGTDEKLEPTREPALEPTPEPTVSTQPVATEQPDDSSTVPGDSTIQPAPTEKPNEIEEPVVVKKLITKISGIKTPKGAALKKNSRIMSIKRNGKSVKIVLKKVKKAKYEVRYADQKNMKHAKKKRSNKRTIYIRKLIKNKKYYLQARVWKKKKGKRIYGKWSKKRRI